MSQNLTLLDIRRWRQLLAGVLASPIHFSLGWLKDHKWAAVPVEEQITAMDAEWIADAATQSGVGEAISISTKPEVNPDCFAVPMTQIGLLEFDERVIPRSFLLVPQDRGYAILHEGDHYFIIAGPYNFVRRAVGCSLATARTMFRERYAKDFYNEKTRSFLLAVAERYEPFDGEIPTTDHQPAGVVHTEMNNRKATIVPLAAKQYRHLLSGLLETKTDLALEWLRAHHWVAVPLSAPINEMTAEWLAKAADTMAVKKCFAVSTDPDATPACLEVPMTQSALLDFENQGQHSQYVLLPEDRSFAILHEGKLFLVVAGPRSFVRTAVGCSFPTAFMVFRDRLMATAYDTEEEEAIIKATAARYEALSAHDADG